MPVSLDSAPKDHIVMPLPMTRSSDPIIQAQTGFAAVQGQGKDAPEFMQSLMCDKVTAYTASRCFSHSVEPMKRLPT